MIRKVVKQGPATFMVSLPSTWVKKNRIKKGDTVEVLEKGPYMTITTQPGGRAIRLEADVSGLEPRLVDRLLARSYQKGYDEILLIHNNTDVLKVIQQKVTELMGYEIMEQSNKTCLIQSLSHKMDINFEESLRKAFVIVKQMAEEMIEAYAKDRKEDLQNLYLKDLEVNRFCYYCLRQINKEQYYTNPQDAQQTHVLYYLIEELEDLGDGIKKIASRLSKSKKNKSMLELLKLLKQQYERSYSYFYEPTKQKANEAYKLFQKIDQQVEQLAEKSKNEETFILILLRETAHIIYHFSTMRLDSIKDMKKEIKN